MTIRHTRKALRHLGEIRAYIERDRPSTAKAVGESIQADAAKGRVVKDLSELEADRVLSEHVDPLGASDER